MNYEYEFKDIVEGLNNLECAGIIWRYCYYIYQTKHDVLCGLKNVSMVSSR